MPGAWARPSPSVYVYVRVMLPLLLPPARGPAYTRHACTCRARTWPQSSCLSWALCKHFCACWGGAHLRGAAPGLRDRGPSQRGGWSWIQAHNHHRGMCPRMLRVFILHTPESRRPTTTHISCCTPRGRSRLSHLVSVHTCLSHAALFHPPRDTRRLLPDPTPLSPASRCPAWRGV